MNFPWLSFFSVFIREVTYVSRLGCGIIFHWGLCFVDTDDFLDGFPCIQELFFSFW